MHFSRIHLQRTLAGCVVVNIDIEQLEALVLLLEFLAVDELLSDTGIGRADLVDRHEVVVLAKHVAGEVLYAVRKRGTENLNFCLLTTNLIYHNSPPIYFFM